MVIEFINQGDEMERIRRMQCATFNRMSHILRRIELLEGENRFLRARIDCHEKILECDFEINKLNHKHVEELVNSQIKNIYNEVNKKK